MIYVLYGADIYRSRQKLREITKRFFSVAGVQDAAFHLSFPGRSRLDAEQVIGTGSLFREKRFVVLEDASDAGPETQEYIKNHIADLAASDDIFLFWEGPRSLERNPILPLVIPHAAKAQEFKKLSIAASAAFVESEAAARRVSLSAYQKQYLIAAAQKSLWRVVGLLEQLSLGGANVQLETGVSDQLLYSFTDSIGSRKKRDAWVLFHRLLDAGIESERLFWVIVRHTQMLIRAHAFADGTVSAAAAFARAGRVHPFVAKKAVFQARLFSASELLLLHDYFVRTHVEAKRGRGDMALGLERAILSL